MLFISMLIPVWLFMYELNDFPNFNMSCWTKFRLKFSLISNSSCSKSYSIDLNTQFEVAGNTEPVQVYRIV